jgi:hypothetical protein
MANEFDLPDDVVEEIQSTIPRETAEIVAATLSAIREATVAARGAFTAVDDAIATFEDALASGLPSEIFANHPDTQSTLEAVAVAFVNTREAAVTAHAENLPATAAFFDGIAARMLSRDTRLRNLLSGGGGADA